MFIKLIIDIRIVDTPWFAIFKLRLNPRHSFLIISDSLLIIWTHLCNWFLNRILQYLVDVEFIRQLDVKIYPSLSVSLVDMPQTLAPHFEIVLCVPFVVGVYYFCQLARLEFAIDPF